MVDLPEARGLLWLVINFPYVKFPQDDCDRLSNAIHVHAQCGLDCIQSLQKEVELLSTRLAEVSGDG